MSRPGLRWAAGEQIADSWSGGAHRNRPRALFYGLRIAFAGRQEEVHFDAMLPGVEVPIAAPQSVKTLACAAFDDASGLDHQDLIGAPDGGEAVRDYEGRAALHQVAEAFLDERLGLGV